MDAIFGFSMKFYIGIVLQGFIRRFLIAEREPIALLSFQKQFFTKFRHQNLLRGLFRMDFLHDYLTDLIIFLYKSIEKVHARRIEVVVRSSEQAIPSNKHRTALSEKK